MEAWEIDIKEAELAKDSLDQHQLQIHIPEYPRHTRHTKETDTRQHVDQNDNCTCTVSFTI